jgi:hypothetical protein
MSEKGSAASVSACLRDVRFTPASGAKADIRATGVINISTELTAKRLELLRELVPTAALIAVLFNPASPDAEGQITEVERIPAGPAQADDEPDFHRIVPLVLD